MKKCFLIGAHLIYEVSGLTEGSSFQNLHIHLVEKISEAPYSAFILKLLFQNKNVIIKAK